ncbi:uncharacterized protein DAT39_007994 [Clarias magur]|uniref:Uncharacterized protein n=1 Tax=Clarias magur TaxID=1594786 RepID=A0A8J4UAM7_CLAMG|nr:uncharacterized protein DAT39_007994 [Clarias magur]
MSDAHLQQNVMESPFSGFELFFIILAFTVFCVVGLAAIYMRRDVADNPGEMGLIEQNTIHRKTLKRKKEFQMSRK